MVGKAQHRADQAGITVAQIGALYALNVAILIGAFWQFLDPTSEFGAASGYPIYRFAMLGILAACIAWNCLMVWLGGSDKLSEHRGRYLTIRNSITNDGIEHFYARGIRWMLAKVDRFFEGNGKRGTVRLQKAFGLQVPAPLWTPQSYDRCLLIALIYPIAVILLVWVWSGHVGAAETALGLPVADTTKRITILALMAVVFRGLWTYHRQSSWKHWYGLAIGAVAGAGVIASASAVAGAGASAVSGAFVFTAFIAIAVAGSGAGAHVGARAAAGTATTAVAAAVSVAVADAAAFPGAIAFALAVALLILVQFLIANGRKRNRLGVSLLLLTVAFLIASIIAPLVIPHGKDTQSMVALLYFMALLALVNAPFDWLALGMTRGLLRRGLELGAAWPIALGIADLVLSILLLLALAIAALLATELFNYMALQGGLKASVDPAQLFPALIKTPSAPEHVWLFAMLFSTQAPALINLMFGTFCVLRGLPGINRWMAARLPETGNIGVWQRLSISSVYALQLGASVACGLITFYYLFVYGLVWLLDAAFGTSLIEMLQAISIKG